MKVLSYGEGEDEFFTAAEAGGEECPEQPASVAELVVKQPRCWVVGQFAMIGCACGDTLTGGVAPLA